VGFRPFVCRMAAKHGLAGEVDNRSDGVAVLVQGDLKIIDRFSNDLLQNAPPASEIKSIEIKAVKFAGFDSFKIAPSRPVHNQITEISPDIAVCKECLDDLAYDPERIDYPFINCTNCGPRFSIIEDLPYDRRVTSMKVFKMCGKCRSEYTDLLDRRFHAQPIACNSCGPVYQYKAPGKTLHEIQEILMEITFLIASGKTIAVKSVGGYHLMCDALNNDAVADLRNRKQRDAKPFAVMFRDMAAIRKYCYADESEGKELTSWRRPVVILRQRRVLSPSISNGLKTTGALLPYMPLHYMLFRLLDTPAVVLTSGNMSDEPIITDDHDAGVKLKLVTNFILSYNRKVVNRTDDSVIRVINKKVNFIRRSRGYAPRPVDLKLYVEGVFAAGAEQKNTFCLGKGNQALVSQYIGDIRNAATYNFYCDAVSRFSKLFRFKPSLVACDLHPDYLSTGYAEKFSSELKVPLLRIQHHHAHIASCMAENGLEEEVIGISLDGTGYGTDGNIWGGEFMIADLNNLKRYSHFDYIPLPGGDKAVDEPWRIAFSYIYKYMGDKFDYESLPLFRSVGHKKLSIVKDMIDRKVNVPLSSGAGRLFDAVSAIIGLCPVATFDSEGPMRLESAINEKTDDYYPFQTGPVINFSAMLEAIITDTIRNNISAISARFHNTIARVILNLSGDIRKETSINKVILSGGVFQNKYLVEKSISLLKANKFKVFTNSIVPANDGGIALGQLIIASKTRR
jgi:hydrogenase maturation protein HypF